MAFGSILGFQSAIGGGMPTGNAWPSSTASSNKIPTLPLLGVLGGGLLGALGSGGNRYPSFNKITSMFGPQALAGDTEKLYGFLSHGAGFQNLLSQSNAQASQFQNSLAANLAQRGLTTTGIGSIANAAGGSAAQFSESALRGGLFNQASDMAQQNLMARLQAWAAFQQQQASQPSFLQQLGGSLSGAAGLAGLF